MLVSLEESNSNKTNSKGKPMAFIDLGNPSGEIVVAGFGATAVAKEVGGCAVDYVTPEEYKDWYEATRSGQVSPVCGALALEAAVGQKLVGGDDFGCLVATREGSGSF